MPGGDPSFRTARGRADLGGGELRVHGSVADVLAGWHERRLASQDRLRAAWHLLKAPLLLGTVWRFGGAVADGVQPGLQELFAVAIVGLFAVALPYRLYRDLLSTTTVPLAGVERAEIDPAELTVTLDRPEGETALDLRSAGDVEPAREGLSLRGVPVTVLDVEADGPERSAFLRAVGRTRGDRASADLESESVEE